MTEQGKYRATDEARMRGLKYGPPMGFAASPTPRWHVFCDNRDITMRLEDPFTPGGCQPIASIGGGKNLPPDVIERKIIQKGWTHRGDRWYCPHCSKGSKAMKAEQIATEAEIKAISDRMDAKVMRRTISAIEDVFDEVRMLYAGAESDATVAKRLDMSPEFVAKVRREAFGELAEDPELAKVRGELLVLKEDISRAEGKLLDKVAAILDPIRADADKLIERIHKLEIRGGRK